MENKTSFQAKFAEILNIKKCESIKIEIPDLYDLVDGIDVEILIPSVYGSKCIARMHLTEFPHCCGVAVFSDLNVERTYSKKGIGTLMHQLAKQICFDCGYSLMICADRTKNTSEIRILRKQKFKKLYSFKNSRTKNEIGVFSTKLKNIAPIFNDEDVQYEWKQDCGDFS